MDTNMEEMKAQLHNSEIGEVEVHDKLINDLETGKLSLSYIEITQLIEKINKSKAQYESAIGFVNEIDTMDILGENGEKNIIVESALKDVDYDGNRDAFMEEYNSVVPKLDKLLVILNEKLSNYADKEKTTSFYTEEMIILLNKKIDRCIELELPVGEVIQLERMKEAFMSRSNYSYLTTKSEITHTIKACKKIVRNKETSAIRKIRKTMLTIFNETQLSAFEMFVRNVFGGDKFATETFMLHMSKIATGEHRTGYYNWVKVFIMNILDMKSNICDVPEIQDNTIMYLRSVYDKYKA